MNGDRGQSGFRTASGRIGRLIEDETISTKIAKDVFEDMLETSKSPGDIVEEKGLKQITDTGAIEAIVDQVIADNPGQADDVRGGNDKAIGWFVGQVMKASQGKANPGQVNQLLRAKLFGVTSTERNPFSLTSPPDRGRGIRARVLSSVSLSHAIAGERTGEGALFHDIHQIPRVRFRQAMAKGCRRCPPQIGQFATIQHALGHPVGAIRIPV